MRYRRQITALLLLTLYLSYFSFSHFFVHSHNATQGVIVHSHPFAKNKCHTHTNIEVQLIDELSNYVCEEMEDTPPLPTPTVYEWQYVARTCAVSCATVPGKLRPRAPPTV